jgi:hypothetical protein
VASLLIADALTGSIAYSIIVAIKFKFIPMTHNQIVTDILYLIYVDELVAENFVYDEKGYQQALNEAIKSGLITKKSTTYQLTDKGIALVESGGSEDYMNK